MADFFKSDPSFGKDFFSSKTVNKGFNPTILVVVVVLGVVLTFLLGNYFMYSYAQKVLPPRKKKVVSKKKLKRERLKQGMAPVAD